jgi:biopolymer transport protein ExbB
MFDNSKKLKLKQKKTTNMSNNKTSGGFSFIVSLLAIAICVGIGVIVFQFLLGSPGNFDADGPEKGHPINFWGNMYKGGFIVPILLGVFFTVFTFFFERLITISKATGRGNVSAFVAKIKGLIANGDLDAAIAECDKQKGSLGNVVKEGLLKYQFVQNDTHMDKEAKVAAISKALEEATALELPMLSKNMVIISTCASVGTLVGLIGTVVGMIRAFGALAAAGTPDTAALATGISEALVNTLVGILSSALAIIFYNLFSNRVDQLTFAMDEAGFTIIQEFQTSGK